MKSSNSSKKVDHTKVDFIGIGAQKSGTSWLHTRLKELPDFSLPHKKEIHYFDRNPKYPSSNSKDKTSFFQRVKQPGWLYFTVKEILYNYKIGNHKKARWLINWHYKTYNDSWYLSLFNKCNGFTGEVSPSYAMLDIEDITKMHSMLPDTKLIYLMRNPIDRAWSHYRFKKRHLRGTQHLTDITQIIEFIDSPDQHLRSSYCNTLSNYTHVYPKHQIIIGFYDAIAEQPAELLCDVVQFIGGDMSSIQSCCKLRDENNKSPHYDLPAPVLEYLKKKYYNEIKNLSGKFGGYCSKWLYDMYGEGLPPNREEFSPTTRLNY